MAKPMLSRLERQARLRNYQRRHPKDQLIKYLITHYEVIERIYTKCGDFDLVMPTIEQLGLTDAAGRPITFPILRRTWQRINDAIDRIQQFDKIAEEPPPPDPSAPATD